MVPRPLDCTQSGPEYASGGIPGASGVPADRAMAFLSKSFLDVRKSAESDLKLISTRTQGLKKIAEQLDDWENIKLPAVFPLKDKDKDVTAGTLIRKIKDRSLEITKPLGERALSIDSELDLFFKSWEQHVPPALSKLKKFQDAGNAGRAPVSLKPFDGRQFINLDEWNKAVKAHTWPLGESWTVPLQRAMKEAAAAAASAAATSPPAAGPRSPAEFLEAVKKNLKLSASKDFSSELHPDVLPLDVPEVLESFVRNSEVLLDHLGMDKAVATKVRSTIRTLRAGTAGAASDAAADVDARVQEIMRSTGYRLDESDAGWWSAHASSQHGAAQGGAQAQGATGKVAVKAGVLKKGEAQEEIQQEQTQPQQPQPPVAQQKQRKFAIVTTASLPWMTGTAVNPLLRAAYLAALGKGVEVTLLVPWLARAEQGLVYPRNMTFDSPAEQEAYMRKWLLERVGFQPDMKIAFYPGRFSTEKRSILAVGDISSFIPDGDADVAVLEEPEHLTWYYHGRRWTDKFKHVVGIIHTNYLEYVRREKNGPLQAFLLEHVNNWMVRCYCNNVVRLSAATQDFPRASVCNVHGVGVKFLNIGQRVAAEMQDGGKPFSQGAYYLGKMVWGKGYRELVDLLAENRGALGGLKVDVFGSGEDSEAVRAEAKAKGLTMKFHAGRDHADSSLHKFKVFINPSLSDVVCTTTAEALAMGKIVVCADHPSNDFFRSFPNCFIYRNQQEFVEKVQQAMASQPQPLSDQQRHMLSWEAATERFLRSSGIEHELSHLLPSPVPSTAALSRSPSTLSLTAPAAAVDFSSPPTPSAATAAAAGADGSTRLSTRSRSSGDLLGAASAASPASSPTASASASPAAATGLVYSASAFDLSAPTSSGSSASTSDGVVSFAFDEPQGQVQLSTSLALPQEALFSNTSDAWNTQPHSQNQANQASQAHVPSHAAAAHSRNTLLPSASLSLSVSAPDLTDLTDRFLSFSHFMASGIEAARLASGALPNTMHVDEEMSKDLGLPHPWAQRPSYGCRSCEGGGWGRDRGWGGMGDDDGSAESSNRQQRSVGTTSQDLMPLFERYGTVSDIFIPKDKRTGTSRGFAFVRFKHEDEAAKAVERLDGTTVDGREIMVKFAKYGRNEEIIDKGMITEVGPPPPPSMHHGPRGTHSLPNLPSPTLAPSLPLTPPPSPLLPPVLLPPASPPTLPLPLPYLPSLPFPAPLSPPQTPSPRPHPAFPQLRSCPLSRPPSVF
ncbi:unnamed protein product [Closterium sp. Naga37s-1]|nr:unnamed protein product [Closterium sp. Naga37s-1]